MAIGTSDGEYYPSHLESVLASLDTSGSTKAPLAPRNTPMEQFRDENDMDLNLPGTDMRRRTMVAQAGPDNKDTSTAEGWVDYSHTMPSIQSQDVPGSDMEWKKQVPPSYSGEITDSWHEIDTWRGKTIDPSALSPSDLREYLKEKGEAVPLQPAPLAPKEKNPRRPMTENDSIPPNARPTAAEFTPDSTWAAMVDSFTNPDSKVPSAEKMVQGNYSKVVDWLTENGKTPGQEMQNWSAKEKLGYMLSTAMGLVGAGKGGVPTRGVLSGKSGVRDVSDIHQSGKGSAVNDNYPDTAEFSNLRMSASEMKEYLADRAERPLTNDMTKAEIDKMISTWEGANTPPSAYERALANQKAGRMNPAGDSADEFIQSLRRGNKPNLTLVDKNPPQEPQGRPVPSLTQRQTQEAQRAANDRNYAMGEGTERVNVGQGKGVLNNNKEEVMALIDTKHTPSEIAQRFDITSLAVRNWIKRNGNINDASEVLQRIENNKSAISEKGSGLSREQEIENTKIRIRQIIYDRGPAAPGEKHPPHAELNQLRERLKTLIKK